MIKTRKLKNKKGRKQKARTGPIMGSIKRVTSAKDRYIHHRRIKPICEVLN